jgi:H+/Cl- antiporter ClcA
MVRGNFRRAIHTDRWLMLIVTITVGIASGIGGMALGLLLRLVQHIAFGYSLHRIVGGESFLQGVTAASDWRRFLALCICGAVAGAGWWLLHRFGRPLVSISQAVRENGPPMPLLKTIAHDLLQIVTVGLGSPLGREVAPRELGAAFATSRNVAGLGGQCVFGVTNLSTASTFENNSGSAWRLPRRQSERSRRLRPNICDR